MNLAAHIIDDEKAGLTVPPSDTAAYVDAAARLYVDGDFAAGCAKNARAYAERTFDIGEISKKFTDIINQ